MTRQAKHWNFEEVAKVLSDKRPEEEVAKELGRSRAAVHMVNTLVNWYKRDNQKQYISQQMRNHFERFFAEQKEMSTDDKSVVNESTPVVSEYATEICEHQMDTLVQQAEQQFQLLQQTMAELAKWQAKHATHTVTAELEQLQEWKKTNEPLLNELKQFKEKAENSGFGNMLRSMRPF